MNSKTKELIYKVVALCTADSATCGVPYNQELKSMKFKEIKDMLISGEITTEELRKVLDTG